MPPAIFLMGPTASGKTGVAVDLGQQLPVELISVDSALVFRDMDIGTAKPDAKLHVFQRTAAWVIPRDERTYSEGAKQRFARHPWWRTLHRARLYWTNESRVWPIFHAGLSWIFESFARWHLRRQVQDPELARRLTPDYKIGCKRVLVSNVWYPMFSRPNVELVTDCIREVTERGIVTEDGVEREVDCIILGTGFAVDPRIYMRNFPITGLPGHSLAEDWKGGAEAYYGISVSGWGRATGSAWGRSK